MNTITAQRDTIDYGDNDEILNIKVDGDWLDEKLHNLAPQYKIKGLVPTLLPWLVNENERQVVWSRILPRMDELSVCPILMCPDDCDFSCTIIIVEIKNEGDQVQWLRAGLDCSESIDSLGIGSKVEWILNFDSFQFKRDEYGEFIEKFRKGLDQFKS